MNSLGKREKTSGKENDQERERKRKGRIAKRYLGLQGMEDETGTMDESEKPLSCGEDMESDFKRLRAESVNATFESL